MPKDRRKAAAELRGAYATKWAFVVTCLRLGVKCPRLSRNSLSERCYGKASPNWAIVCRLLRLVVGLVNCWCGHALILAHISLKTNLHAHLAFSMLPFVILPVPASSSMAPKAGPPRLVSIFMWSRQPPVQQH